MSKILLRLFLLVVCSQFVIKNAYAAEQISPQDLAKYNVLGNQLIDYAKHLAYLMVNAEANLYNDEHKMRIRTLLQEIRNILERIPGKKFVPQDRISSHDLGTYLDNLFPKLNSLYEAHRWALSAKKQKDFEALQASAARRATFTPSGLQQRTGALVGRLRPGRCPGSQPSGMCPSPAAPTEPPKKRAQRIPFIQSVLQTTPAAATASTFATATADGLADRPSEPPTEAETLTPLSSIPSSPRRESFAPTAPAPEAKPEPAAPPVPGAKPEPAAPEATTGRRPPRVPAAGDAQRRADEAAAEVKRRADEEARRIADEETAERQRITDAEAAERQRIADAEAARKKAAAAAQRRADAEAAARRRAYEEEAYYSSPTPARPYTGEELNAIAREARKRWDDERHGLGHDHNSPFRTANEAASAAREYASEHGYSSPQPYEAPTPCSNCGSTSYDQCGKCSLL